MICSEGVEMPRRSTEKSAGYDFYAPHDFELKPGEWTDIDTGVRFDGYEDAYVSIHKTVYDIVGPIDMKADVNVTSWVMLLFPRSGLGTKYGVRFATTVGVVDCDYKNNIRAKMTSDVPITIHKGERFMQGVIVPFGMFRDEVRPTEVRKGGFGSTGL